MRNVYDCVKTYAELLDYEYHLILGRKGVTVDIYIRFDKVECFHLMGLQYLTDRPELVRDRGKIFDQILNGIIVPEHLESSVFYNKIQKRVDKLPLLEKIIDSNDTIFKYNKKLNTYSVIKADFLMKNEVESENIFVFLSKTDKQDYYFCRSFFPEERLDYTKNQASWTLLYKSKKNLVTNDEIILYNRLNRE